MAVLSHKTYVDCRCNDCFNCRVLARWREHSHNLVHLKDCLFSMKDSNENDLRVESPAKMLKRLIAFVENEERIYEHYSRAPYIRLVVHDELSYGAILPNTAPNYSINYNFRVYKSAHDEKTYCLKTAKPSRVAIGSTDYNSCIRGIPTLFEATCMGLSYLRTKKEPERELFNMDMFFEVGEYELTLN